MDTKTSCCALCSHLLPHFPIFDGEKGFCCAGCHAVFQILSSKNQLSNYEQHPLFQQALKSGLISNPVLLEQIRQNQIDLPDQEKHKLHLEIENMWCPSCAEIIRLILLQKKGIHACIVDYATDLASIEYYPRYISKDEILESIRSLSYQPAFLQDSKRKAVSTDLYLRFAIAVFCALNVMMFAYPLYATYFDEDPEGHGITFAWLSLTTSLPVIFYSATPILKRFFLSMKVGILGMEVLVVIGVSAAFVLSLYELLIGGTKVYFDSMTVIITFVLLGKIIETKAKFSAKDSLMRLNRSLPRKGRKRFSDGSERYIFVKEILPNDLIVVFSGEKIVLDGVIVEGEGYCDESFMTGEALPVTKCVEDLVLGGSILQQGRLIIKVSASLEQTALHKIIEMIEQDIGHKSTYVRYADHIVQWFVPLVVSIAILTALVCLFMEIADVNKTVTETAMKRAISILLISCPCAIGIAAPLAESHLMNGLLRLGAIVRNRGSLALLGDETTFIFDKTGTITKGSFTLVKGFEQLSHEQQAILKGLASQSNHLMAKAIAESLEVISIPLSQVVEHPGKGLIGQLNQDRYYLGSETFLKQQGIHIPQTENCQEEMTSDIYFAKNQSCLTILSLGDQIRGEAKEVIADLFPKKTILLSGDAERSVKAVAKACGFDEYYWGYHPLQKKEFVDQQRKQGEIVCVIGDGINDAPALTAANIGISVINATDISIQVSDILLTTDQLSVLSKIRALAKKGKRVIKQNLFWAFFYNLIGICLAINGTLSPIFASIAMVGSSLMVLFNAKRI